MYKDFVALVRDIYQTDEFIPLHAPVFKGNEKKYLLDTIDSTFVSSVGVYVDGFERKFAEYVGADHAIATMNGTAALHIALLLAGVESGDEVITQPLTFVATCNAIAYCGASPVFVDVDQKTLGLSVEHLKHFFEEFTCQNDDQCINKRSGKVIKACVPMHTFGHALEIDSVVELCKVHNVLVIEDAAESLGSYYHAQHTGCFGELGVFSFNGNKILTTGGGGMIVTNNPILAKKAKHLTTTAKMSHSWEYSHDEVGYNYRLPNVNAALGVAQLEQLTDFLTAKRQVAKRYEDFFSKLAAVDFVTEPENTRSNYWLNAILLKSKAERDQFLKATNDQGVMTRPAWNLQNTLPGRDKALTVSDSNAKLLADRLVNIPSGVPTA